MLIGVIYSYQSGNSGDYSRPDVNTVQRGGGAKLLCNELINIRKGGEVWSSNLILSLVCL